MNAFKDSLLRDREKGKGGDTGQRVQSSSFKMKKFEKSNDTWIKKKEEFSLEVRPKQANILLLSTGVDLTSSVS